ncbi:MAG: 2Fe-2S iron-sulfur cluster binding domain-containing protein [Acholeplasmataceae bacterium]|nr:2Fe-2S iron-sulfur cluster binding domain-containing protein [Acholeplasmataceae bacterium]
MKVSFVLNQRNIVYDVSPDEYLLDSLRRNHILSVKKGCGESTCGVCTVLLNGKPILSCTVLTASISGKNVTTVDGLQDEIEEISNHYGHEGADQCGFCNAGLALTIYAMKKELKNPTDDEIRHYTVGNLCRCSGYDAQLRAIKSYLEASK